MILADPYNPTAQAHRDRLVEALPGGTLPDPHDEGLTVVIGGDGFMLQSATTHGFDRTYLGLNAGRIGFLLNDIRDWDRAVARIVAGAWSVHRFPLLEATLAMADGTTRIETAINDVALERSTGQTAHLALGIDDRPIVDRLVADGLILATALGSTAYTFSAGGPACHPTLRMMVVTPICAHHPKLSPFVLPESATAQVEVLASHRRPVRAVIDGRTLDDVVGATVTRSPEHDVRLAYLEGHDPTERMVTKILHP